mmetsp:Transcript_88885/g.163003  ORF Transcript_88885/g.163003 Transcript_88885/m.163003 type:complete len:242 (+) Transcript_88885:77-802(+)
MMMMPQQSMEEMKLVKYVKCTACTQFAFSVIAQLVIGMTLMAVLKEIPNNYDDFVQQCYGSQVVDQYFEEVCDAWCQSCARRGFSIQQCNRDGEFTDLVQTITASIMEVAFAACVLGLCCAACVPACGFFGARGRNSCLLIVYMIFNLISLLYGAYSLFVGAQLAALLGMIMPFASIYFAYKLQKTISNPVQQQPLMPGQYTQPVSVQPVVAQPVTVTPVQPTMAVGQQPQTAQQPLYDVQ